MSIKRRMNVLLLFAFVFSAAIQAHAQTVTLFGNAIPQSSVNPDNAVNLGVKFSASEAGTINGIRFFRGHTNSGGYAVKLYTAGGSLLGSAAATRDTCTVPCWEQIKFTTPISIAANTTYVAAYYTSHGNYADDTGTNGGLTNGVTNGPLTAPASAQVGGNGVYAYSTGFPNQTWNDSNYYVDVLFSPITGKGSVMRAYDLYFKFGVNTDHTTASPSEIQANLATVGLNRIRDYAYAEPDMTGYAQLAAAGVYLHIMYEAYLQTPPVVTDWLSWLKNDIVTPYPGKVLEISGPNEIDNVSTTFTYNGVQGIPGANLAQHDLYTGIKADAAFNGIKVDMWPMAFPYDYNLQQQVGDQTANCDQPEMHDYYPADNTNQVYGGVKTNSAAITDYFNFGKIGCNRPTFVTSEDGWCTPLNANCPASNNSFTTEYTAARMTLLTMMDHAKRPENTGVYYFTLCCGEGWWSLMHGDGNPKQAGVAMKNLTTILNDPGSSAATFQSTALAYSLSGMPGASENFLLEKSDGTYVIVLENNIPIWNVNTQAQINPGTSSVTVTLPRPMSGGVYDATQGSTPLSTFTNQTSVTVGLNDAPLFVLAK